MLQTVVNEATLFNNQKLIHVKLICHLVIRSCWILRSVHW